MREILSKLKKLDWILIICVVLLTLIGLISIYSSSREDFLNFKKQIFFFISGFLLMILVSFFDWRTIRESPYLILLFYFFCLLLLLGLFFFAPKIRGTKSWYQIGPLSFDPTEFTKISLLLLLAKYFSMRHVEMYKINHILISGAYVFLPAILVFFQPNFGSMLILILIWIGILFASGIKLRHFLILLLCGILVLVFGWSKLLKQYQRERILAFLQPGLTDPLKVGWSQNQAKIAIGSSGIFGQGIKKGSQTQLGFLPEPQTDFTFAAIGEEMGFVGIFILLFLFSLLIWRIFKITFESKNNFPRLFACGFSVLITSQLFVHIGMNVGLLPVIGIPLPFVSYGGSSLIAHFIGLGILQSMRSRG